MEITSAELRKILPYGLANKFANWNPFSFSMSAPDDLALNQLKQFIDSISKASNYHLTAEECISVIRLGLACKQEDVEGFFTSLGINDFQPLLRYLNQKASFLITLNNIEALIQGRHRWEKYKKVTRCDYDYAGEIHSAFLTLNDRDTKYLKFTQTLFEALVYFPGAVLLAEMLRDMNYDGFTIGHRFLESQDLIMVAKNYGLNIRFFDAHDQIRVYDLCIQAANHQTSIREVIALINYVLKGIPEIAKNAHILFQAKYSKQQNILQSLPDELLVHIAAITKPETSKLSDRETRKIVERNFTRPRKRKP